MSARSALGAAAGTDDVAENKAGWGAVLREFTIRGESESKQITSDSAKVQNEK